MVMEKVSSRETRREMEMGTVTDLGPTTLEIDASVANELDAQREARGLGSLREALADILIKHRARLSELDVTDWTTLAEEQSPSPNDVTVFTQFMRHGPHYLYRCVRTTSDGTILDITPLGCLDRDAVNP